MTGVAGGAQGQQHRSRTRTVAAPEHHMPTPFTSQPVTESHRSGMRFWGRRDIGIYAVKRITCLRGVAEEA